MDIRAEKKDWIKLSIIWTVFVLVTMTLLIFSTFLHEVQLKSRQTVTAILMTLGFIILPLIARRLAGKAIEEATQLSSDIELLHNLVSEGAASGRKAGLLQEAPNAQAAVARVTASLRDLKRWRAKYAQFLLHIGYLWMFLQLVSWMGSISAASDRAAARGLEASRDARVPAATILLTDGNATLSRERHGDEVFTVYRNKASDIVVNLSTPYENWYRGLRSHRRVEQKRSP
jgi:hypothetical protein